MARDTISHTFKLAGTVCIVCSVLVAGTWAVLHKKQEANRLEDMRRNVLEVAGIYDEDKTIAEQFGRIDVETIDLASGEFVNTEDNPQFDPKKYKPRSASKNPGLSVEIRADQDFGGIKRREKYSIVYLVTNGAEGSNRKVEQVVLPINGKGLWSTLYGFISLDADLTNIKGITFYEHGETPGLGGEVENKRWKEKWKTKQAYDDDGNVNIEVLRGNVDPDDAAAKFKVDGLTGATITSRGVTGMLRYWLGKNGFRPFLDNPKTKDRLAARGQQDG